MSQFIRRTPSPAPGPPVANDDDEVTETKIVGVTETGVIRKRSFKRKMTKEEKSKRYGQDKEDYAKIVQKVMSERLVTSSIEGLQERWKMIRYMHEDCMEMVAQWESARASRLRAHRLWSIRLALSVVSAILVVMFLWSTMWSLW